MVIHKKCCSRQNWHHYVAVTINNSVTRIEVSKVTYIVSRRGKKLEVRATMWWYESTVKSRGDKSKLEGIFPLAHCYQLSLIRHCQLGRSYLHNTFTPRPGLRRRPWRTAAASKLTAIQFSTLAPSMNFLTLKKHIVRGAVRYFQEWWEMIWVVSLGDYWGLEKHG